MVKEGLLYAKSHEWVKIEGSTATVGISDYAQHSMGEIVFVELPDEDEAFEKEDSFGVMESVKAASDIYMPISGKILSGNEALEDAPELLNEDAYENYIVKIQIVGEVDKEGLLTSEEYLAYIETL